MNDQRVPAEDAADKISETKGSAGKTPILEMKNITMIYPNGVIANENVSLICQHNEIHALLGENGAGKSTLMKILFGAQQPTEGEIFIDGKKVVLKNPSHAIDLGIGMVFQHFMMDENLTVTENIVLGMEPRSGISLDYKKAREMVAEVSEKYGFAVNPDSKVGDLDVGKKQKVEILKTLIRGAKILILDEPTAVLTPQETEELFEQLKKLKETGHTIIFISHKLNEIQEICDRATVMRAGKYIGSFDVGNTTVEELSRRMIGRDVVLSIDKKERELGKKVLEVSNVTVKDEEGKTVVDNVSFSVRGGRILGIAGVEGNGQRELVDCITGLSSDYEGEIKIAGEKPAEGKKSVRSRRDLGMYHIPEDRLVYGVVASASIQDNLIGNCYTRPEFQKGLLLNKERIETLADTLISDYLIKTDSKYTPVSMLSGGNMQKVVAAREMSEMMELLVADQPTRGIDVGAAAFIHNRIVELSEMGVGILLISADLNEVLELSDSLIVFYEGTISAYFPDASKVTEEELGLYMLGLKHMSDEEIRRVTQ